MLIHLLNQQFQALVSSEVTVDGDANVIGIGPIVARASETFDLRNRIGVEIGKKRGLKSGDHVTFRTAGGRYWRPMADTIADNGTFLPNCQFKIYRSSGRTGSQIRHGDTVAIAVPRLTGAQRWIKIDGEGKLTIGPSAASMPNQAARFTYFEANNAALGPRDATLLNNLFAGSGPTIILPVPTDMAFGTVAFDVVLNYEGLPPTATQVNLELTPSDAGFHLVAIPGGQPILQNGGRSVVMVEPGRAKKTLFIEGPASRPDPCLLFHDFENLTPVPTCALRVAADAVDNFPGMPERQREPASFPWRRAPD